MSGVVVDPPSQVAFNGAGRENCGVRASDASAIAVA